MSIKLSSVNWMPPGSRLPRSSHKIFSFLQLFKNTLYNIFTQAVGTGVLQIFSTSLCCKSPFSCHVLGVPLANELL